MTEQARGGRDLPSSQSSPEYQSLLSVREGLRSPRAGELTDLKHLPQLALLHAVVPPIRKQNKDVLYPLEQGLVLYIPERRGRWIDIPVYRQASSRAIIPARRLVSSALGSAAPYRVISASSASDVARRDSKRVRRAARSSWIRRMG